MEISKKQLEEALHNVNTANVPCVDEDGVVLDPLPLATDFLKITTVEIIRTLLSQNYREGR